MAAPRWQVLFVPCTASSASVPLSLIKRGIVLVDAGLTLRRLLLSSSSENWRSPPPLKVNSFVLLCLLSLTTAVCVTRLAVDHQMSPMMIQPTSTHVNLHRNRLLFCLPRVSALHKNSLSACIQSFTLGMAARSLFNFPNRSVHSQPR